MEFPFNTIAILQLQATTGLKIPLQILEVQKNLYKNVLFPLTLQACNPICLTSAKTVCKENALVEFSDVVGSLQEKGL